MKHTIPIKDIIMAANIARDFDLPFVIAEYNGKYYPGVVAATTAVERTLHYLVGFDGGHSASVEPLHHPIREIASKCSAGSAHYNVSKILFQNGKLADPTDDKAELRNQLAALESAHEAEHVAFNDRHQDEQIEIERLRKLLDI